MKHNYFLNTLTHTYVYVSIYQPFCTNRKWHKFILSEFEFRVFLFLDWVPHQFSRSHSTQLFTHRWRENSWRHTFPRGTCVRLHQLVVIGRKSFPILSISLSHIHTHMNPKAGQRSVSPDTGWKNLRSTERIK